MARITIEEVYGGEKYDVMSAAMADYLKNGRPDYISNVAPSVNRITIHL